MRKVFLFLVALTVFISSASFVKANTSYLADMNQTLYNDANGLVSGKANDIVQTSDGYIYIANYTGLLKYDGKNFIKLNHSTNEQMPNDGIMTLFVDSDDCLWFGTQTNGVYKKSGNNFTNYTEESTTKYVTKIVEYNGKIIVATTAGAFIVDNGKTEPITELRGLNIIDMVASNSGIWFINHEYSTYFFDFSVLTKTSYIANSLFVDSSNNLYISQRDGKVTILDDAKISNTYKEIPVSLGIANSFAEDSDKRVWQASDTGIGYFMNGAFFEIEGLTMNSSIERIIFDYEGSMWLASSRQGVSKITKQAFSDLSFKLGLSDTIVNAIVKYNDLLYVGCDAKEGNPSSLLAVDETTGLLVSNDLTEYLSETRIRSMVVDSKNNLWVACYNGSNALVKYDGTNIVNFDGAKLSNGQKDKSANQIRAVIYRNGKIIVGSNYGVSVIDENDNNNVTSYETSDSVLSLYADDLSIYACVKSNGVYVFNYQSQYVNELAGLEDSTPLKVKGFKEGLLISAGSRIYYYKSGNLAKINFDASGSVVDFFFVGDKVAVCMDTGICVFEADTILSSNPVFDEYGTNEGLTSSMVANSWSYLDSDNNLYLATNEGVYLVNVNEIKLDKVPPKVGMNSIIIDGVVYDNIDSMKLKRNTKRITFNFAVLTNINDKDMLVEYYLEGSGEKPNVVSLSELPSITYTNLAGGKYVFHLKAINGDGEYSENEILISFSKNYQTTEKVSFKILMFVLGVLAIVGIVQLAIHFRMRRSKARELMYKHLTDETITTIAHTIDAKDKYTNGHSIRVGYYTKLIAEKLGFTPREVENAYYCGLLHDIGKIGIKDFVLNKPDKLTEEEFDQMREHVRIGADILENITTIPNIIDGALYHHERYDGEGYVNKIKGEEIPLIGRIICVADAYDAMSSKRVYRDILSREVILDELEKNKGTQFDPIIAEIMINLIVSGEIYKGGIK